MKRRADGLPFICKCNRITESQYYGCKVLCSSNKIRLVTVEKINIEVYYRRDKTKIVSEMNSLLQYLYSVLVTSVGDFSCLSGFILDRFIFLSDETWNIFM